MTMTTRLIDPNTYGTADHDTTLTFTREASFGGLTAHLTPGDVIFVQAIRWKGVQPRLALHPGDDGYADWKKLLDAAPEINKRVRFVGAAEAADNGIDQWLTHGPSNLL